MSKYVSTGEARRLLGVTDHTLRKWASAGKIEVCRPSETGNRRYNIEKFLRENKNLIEPEKEFRRVCYSRVSTHSQKEDLGRQENLLRRRYPEYQFIRDIGSGLNFKRKGLHSILEYAVRGELKELVVTHKDRLCRFGFEVIEKVVQLGSGGKITILCSDTEERSPEEELTQDLLSIITVFSARFHGRRRYVRKYTRKPPEKKIKKETKENHRQTNRQSKNTKVEIIFDSGTEGEDNS